MTLPSEGRKLDQNEVNSIENAVREAGIQQIHPDKMELSLMSWFQDLKVLENTGGLAIRWMID